MTKKLFVEFYLSAMMKAATAGRVTRLTYNYTYTPPMADMETVAVLFDNGSMVPVNVADAGLLEIARSVLGVLK